MERGVKTLLADINGDNLWNSVLKIKQAQIRKEKRGAEGAARASKRQVRFRDEHGGRGGPAGLGGH